MRTKNAKRLWPVPATLAVVAVAAFLAFGLMATTGAQPAAAQDDADCEIRVNDAGAITPTADPPTDMDSDGACDATGGTATIEFIGPAERSYTSGDDTRTDPYVFYVLSEDRRGDLQYYPVSTIYQGNREMIDPLQTADNADDVLKKPGFYNEDQLTVVVDTSTTPETVTSIPGPVKVGRYVSQRVNVPFAQLEDGTVKSQMVTITVSGDFYIYSDNDVGAGFGQAVPCRTFSPSGRFGTYTDNCQVNPNDFETPTGAQRLIEDGNTGNVDATHTVDITFKGAPDKENSTIDLDESQSEAVNGPQDAISGDATAETGKKRNYTLPADAENVFFTVIIMDDSEMSQALSGGKVEVVVNFGSGSMVDRGTFSYTETYPEARRDELTTEGVVVEIDGWTSGPAKATVSISHVDGDNRLDLDPIVVAVPGSPTEIMASTNICKVDKELAETAGDSSAAPPILSTISTADGCPAINEVPVAETLFQPGDVVVIKADALDALETSLGTDDLEWEEVVAEDAEGITEGRDSGTNFPVRVMLKDEDDAEPGAYSFMVSHDDLNDDTDVAAVTLPITVAGELASYKIAGDRRILQGAAGDFTLQKLDKDGNLTKDSEDVTIVVSGSSKDSVQLLDVEPGDRLIEDGSENFQVFALAGESDGSITITAIGKSGISPASMTVSIGANQMPMAGDAIADQMIDMGATVMVQSTLSDPDGYMLTYAWMSDDEMVATVMADDMDMSMATITGVAVGSAMITVTATDSEGGEGMQTFMVTVEEANVAPMAGADIDPVMMTVGDDPMMVATMFTDANMDDMLTYSEMSSDEMVATAMVDMDGMVTITAVGAGDATITVTATDMDGAYAMQEIMVTVAANMGPMAGEAIADQMLYVGGDAVMVSTMFTDPEEDMLTYSAMSSDEMVATAMVDDMGMVTITPMGAGMATITVTAMDAVSGMDAMQEIMVTVMVAELGDPVVTDAMSNAAGMATIMLTPGANADQHWIWAQPTDLSQGMFSEKVAGDATSANMTGLTSGMSYWFTAVAGRDMEDGPTEWSEYSGWSAETPIQ